MTMRAACLKGMRGGVLFERLVEILERKEGASKGVQCSGI